MSCLFETEGRKLMYFEKIAEIIADKFDIDTAKKLDYFVTIESDNYISYYREPNVKNMEPLTLLNFMYDECKRRNNEESE